ncbi:hypothetical protein J6590_053534 [Homalodisca vitripennis]|nr:hypothetical protein J6590_053534 [Homalodisca vitripennis]
MPQVGMKLINKLPDVSICTHAAPVGMKLINKLPDACTHAAPGWYETDKQAADKHTPKNTHSICTHAAPDDTRLPEMELRDCGKIPSRAGPAFVLAETDTSICDCWSGLSRSFAYRIRPPAPP